MGTGKAITRRAFGIMAAAMPFAFAQGKSTHAQSLPDCSSREQYAEFIIEADRFEAEQERYSVSLSSSRIRSGNTLGYVDIVPFTFQHDGDSQTASDSITLQCKTDDANNIPIFGPGEQGFYEVYSGNYLLFSQSLYSNDYFRPFPNSGAAAHQMLVRDSTVRITVGSSRYHWDISARNLSAAVQAAQSLQVHVRDEYTRKLCQPSAPCLLTTVACREIGLADDCFELRTVRRLRDVWLVNQPFGAGALDWYRENSCKILAAIPARDVRNIFSRFYLLRLVPAVVAERLGLHGWAFAWLRRGVETLHARYVSQTAWDVREP